MMMMRSKAGVISRVQSSPKYGLCFAPRSRNVNGNCAPDQTSNITFTTPLTFTPSDLAPM
jgi:hypothetical protein